jgi:hypothetical protein
VAANKALTPEDFVERFREEVAKFLEPLNGVEQELEQMTFEQHPIYDGRDERGWARWRPGDELVIRVTRRAKTTPAKD